ncbi:tail fiber protein (plasmid) [Pantoea allii]|uniref:phage tail protein n=1 Tax=Pantoea allii TaxID=574096 RepID=UPI003977AD2A
MNTSSDLPIGTIIASILKAESLPDGWLPCNGSVIPSKYQELITLLSSGKTPNLIGRTLVGAGDFSHADVSQKDGLDPKFTDFNKAGGLLIGDTGGEASHKLVTDELPSHSHSINQGDFGYHFRSYEPSNEGPDKPFETSPSTKLSGTDDTGSDKTHFNVQPYYSVSYIIKAISNVS